MSDEDDWYYGVELEAEHSPDTVTAASIAQCLGSDELVEVYNYLEIDLHLLREQLFSDRENEELVLKPMTLKVFQESHDALSAVLRALYVIGYRVHGLKEEIGLHVSIDRSKITEEMLENLMKFFFHNRMQFLAISRRQHRSSKIADFDYMVGNPFRLKPEDEIKQLFEEHLEQLIYNYRKNFEGEKLGVRVYQSRPYVQFTHFNSTLDADELVATIEFMDASMFFVEQNVDYDWGNFLQFIEESKREYIYLKAYLEKIEEVLQRWKNNYRILLSHRN
jgi:hypothetical protein